MLGFYPYILFTQGLALSETPFIFMLLAGFLLLYRWRDRGAHVDLLLAAATTILTLATLIKATLTVLPPVLVAVGAIGRRPPSGIVRVLAAASVVYATLMSPWWIRNYEWFGAFVPFTTSSAQNLYMGNSPNNPQVATYPPQLPPDWAIDHGVNLNNSRDELGSDRRFRDHAIDNIVADPAAFLRRTLIKLGLFWNVVPNAAAFRAPLYRFVAAASFGTVLILAIIGAIERRRQFRDLLPVYVTIAYFTALHAVTIASIRYRLLIEPLLIALAASPLARLARFERFFSGRIFGRKTGAHFS